LIITYAIIGITVVVSMYAFSNANVMSAFILNPYVTNRRQQYYRMVTSGFIHKDHAHLLLNMISLYFFGGVIERVFQVIFGGLGNLYYILLYVLAIVVSDVPTYLKHRTNPGYNSLGASGGVAAVIFACILLLPLNDICLYFAICMPGFILGTLYIIFSYYQGRKANDGINHEAHLYGALFGLVFCAVLYPSSIPRFFEQVSSWKYFNIIWYTL
jgi:membrane associated rhomboid family serine protease